MPFSGSFALRYPHLIPCFPFSFRVPAFPAHLRCSGSLKRLEFSFPVVLHQPYSHQGSNPALPCSRVPPLGSCSGLRLRWYPEGLPLRIQDCCHPLHPRRRLSHFLFKSRSRLSFVHDYTSFRSSIQSLFP